MSTVLTSLADLLASDGLRLGRVWPREPDHLLWEARRGAELVAGQWFASADRAASVADRTPGAGLTDRVVVQPGGADRRLTGLAARLRQPGTELVAHRAERRAVVRLDGPASGPSYVKLVRPDRVVATARLARMAAALPLRVPAVLEVDRPSGAVTMTALPGTPLSDVLAGPDGRAAAFRAGRILARLHATPPPPGLVEHGEVEERQVLSRWRGLARAYGLAPAFPDLVVDPGPDVGPEPALDGADRALLHRDVHDKQFVVGSDGEVGLLDFDLMAVGDPMLDLGNLLAHLDLRERQGLVTDARPLREAVLEGYRPTAAQAARLPGHERRTWQRLSAVYAFRAALGVS